MSSITHTYFVKKINKEKDTLYLDYLKLLEKNNVNLEGDVDSIIHKEFNDDWSVINPNYLTLFIEQFYELDHHGCIDNDTKIINGLDNYEVIIFDIFPINTVKQIIKLFIDNRVYNDYNYTEIKKYLYSHWKDEQISEIVKEITDILIEVPNFTKDEYNDILKNPENPRYDSDKHYMYYVFWLYCFYPLIVIIMKN
jgi:hypothetical protein